MSTDYKQESYEEAVQHFSNNLLAEKLEEQVKGMLPFEFVLEIKEAARRLRTIPIGTKS